MSKASTRLPAGHAGRIDRTQRAIAVVATVLLHLWLAWLLLSAAPIRPNDPQGADAGSAMVVDFVGLTPPQPVQAPHASPPPPVPRPRTRAAPSRVRTTAVERADQAHAPETESPPTAVVDTAPPQPAPATAQRSPAAGAATSPPGAQRARTWGQPPGMLPQATAPVNAGTGRNLTAGRGRGRDASDGPSMEAGGYQVIYDLRSETRLRAWRDAGMTEVFFPLPGTRQYMVCPLETALRRESGPCRMLPPDDPGLADIGDAREVITMHGVYRRGEMLWRGPGAYR